MSVLQSKAQAICDRLDKDSQFKAAFSHGVGDDPVPPPAPSPHPFLDLIMQLLQKLLPILLSASCFAKPGPAQAAKELQNPRLITRLTLGRKIRKHFAAGDHEELGVQAIKVAVLAVGKGTSAEDIAAMSAES